MTTLVISATFIATVTVTVQGPCGDPVSNTHAITVSGGHCIYLPLLLRNAP